VRPALRPVPDLAKALAAGELTARVLLDDCLDRIRALDGSLNAMICVDEEQARSAAAASDRRLAKRTPLGPLDGIPVILKDNIAAAGFPLTCGSRILEGYVPPRDATVTARLRAAGAVLIGKANLDEFGMGSSNEHSAFGAVRNPHDPACVPGGSSGGSCAAVAAGYAPLAFGTDTGGSVRLPASWCGVVGFKPTYGHVSRSGLVAFASSLDQIGPVARTVEGAALAFAAVRGHDPSDATSLPDLPDEEAAARHRGRKPVQGMRVGVIRGFLGEGVHADVTARAEEAIDALRNAGARVHDVELPHARYAIAAYYVIASAEASSNLARFDGVRYGHRAADPASLEDLYVRTRTEGFGAEVRRRILLGTFALSAGYAPQYYGRASRVRDLIRRDFDAAFASADVLVSPVAPTPAFRLGERTDDPLAMYLTDAMTIPASLAGLPAVSVPMGTAGALPVGLQILGPATRDSRVLCVAAALEAALGPAAPPALAGASS
jgi:aspartyl-tRNA(Asn)/glutamyl-tRNA(Gln) amidotransferase subunit A